MNDEDATVAVAVQRVLGDVVKAVDEIVARLAQGGRLFYTGTGTSGRLGVLDASECPPTFGVSPELVQGVIAGGYDACYRAVEASEDDAEAGAADLKARGFGAGDALVGIAASGRTPYTVGAVKFARELGAFTVALTCVPGSAITEAAELSIVPVVGPEVLTGSSRLKAGTAQKMVLNMISTGTMVRRPARRMSAESRAKWVSLHQGLDQTSVGRTRTGLPSTMTLSMPQAGLP